MINLMKHCASTQVWAMHIHLPSLDDSGGEGRDILFQAQRTDLCLTEGSFANYAQTTACSLDGAQYFLLRAFVRLHSSPERHLCKNVSTTTTTVCVHHHAGVVGARNMLTRQPAPFPADLSGRYPEIWLPADVQRREILAPEGRWLFQMLRGHCKWRGIFLKKAAAVTTIECRWMCCERGEERWICFGQKTKKQILRHL